MSLEQQLFDLVGQSKFTLANELIKQNQTIDLNALNKDKNSYLDYAISNQIATANYYEFIDNLLSNQAFKLVDYTSDPDDPTPFEYAIITRDVELVRIFLKQQPGKRPIHAIDYKDELQYTRIKNHINDIEKSLKEEKSDDSILEKRLTALKSLLAIFRDATIRHAINTDNVELFLQLDKEGAEPSEYLLDKILPVTLLSKDKQPQLSGLFKSRSDEAVKSLNESAERLGRGFSRLNDLNKQLETLEQKITTNSSSSSSTPTSSKQPSIFDEMERLNRAQQSLDHEYEAEKNKILSKEMEFLNKYLKK